MEETTMAENNEKPGNEVDINQMSLEEIFAIKDIDWVREIVTRMPKEPGKSRNGGDYRAGWGILRVPVKGGFKFVGAFNTMLGSDFEAEGWGEYKVFDKLPEAVKSLTPVVVDNKDCETGVDKIEDSQTHQDLVDDVASILAQKGHQVRKHVPVSEVKYLHSEPFFSGADGIPLPKTYSNLPSLNPLKCECGHVQPEHENNKAKCMYCDCEGYVPDTFQYNPCDGCGEVQACEGDAFPCVVKGLQKYKARQASLAFVMLLSLVLFASMYFGVMILQSGLEFKFAMFVGVGIAAGFPMGATIFKLYLDAHSKTIKPATWVYRRLTITPLADMSTEIEVVTKAIGGASEIHIDTVDTVRVSTPSVITVVAKPGAPRHDFDGWSSRQLDTGEDRSLGP
jgi:hypothetical protein